MYKITLTIGSNNDTKQVEKEKAIAIVSEYYTGFTVLPKCTGYWQGTREDSIIIEIIQEDLQFDKVMMLCSELKIALQQDSILVDWNESNAIFL